MNPFLKKFPLVLCLSAAISGCTVGPDYKKPEIKIEDKWHTEAPTTQSTVPLKDIKWWQNFNDPILNNLIEEAGHSNLDIEAALARVRGARANLTSSEADLFPSLTAVGAVTKNQYGKNVAAGMKAPAGASTTASAGFDASWELDIFGRVRRATESAEAGLESIVEDGRAIILSLLGEVALNYVNLRNYQQQLLIQQEVVAAWKMYSDLRKSLMDTGLASDIDEIAAEVSYNQAVVQIPKLEASIQTTLNQLCLLLAKQPGSLDQMLKQPAEIPQMDQAILSNLPGMLIEQRSDVRKAEENLRSVNATIGVAEGNLYPKFSLTGTLGWASGGLVSGANSLMSVGPGLSLPIFDFGKLRAQVDIQYAERDQAFIQFKQAILSALQDTENSLEAFVTENQRLLTFKKTFDVNKMSYDLMADRQHSGLASTLDVLQIKFSYLSSQQDYATSLGAHSISMINVYKSLGGGWDVVEVPKVDQKIDVEHIDLTRGS